MLAHVRSTLVISIGMLFFSGLAQAAQVNPAQEPGGPQSGRHLNCEVSEVIPGGPQSGRQPQAVGVKYILECDEAVQEESDISSVISK